MLAIVALLLGLTAVRVGISSAERGKVVTLASPRLRAFGETIEIVIIAICAVFLVIRPFFVQAFYIPSASMSPTLKVDDRLLVNKLTYRFSMPARNDVVVFKAPEKAQGQISDGEEIDFVKRVIGLPGDTIEVHAGDTYINGQLVKEPRAAERPDYDLAPFTVPRNKLFVLGDNRNHSNDSHRWGALDRDSVIGKATFIFWPPARAGFIH
jgi:signal peptidase I